MRTVGCCLTLEVDFVTQALLSVLGEVVEEVSVSLKKTMFRCLYNIVTGIVLTSFTSVNPVYSTNYNHVPVVSRT